MAPDRGANRRLDVRSKPLKKNGLERARKQASLGRQIRDIQRLLKLNLSQEVRQAQESRLKQLKDNHNPGLQPSRVKVDRNISKRYKQVKFVERRKVERGLRRAEKELKNAPDEKSKDEAAAKLQQLKQDLEYIKFFPKSEKYVSLFMENADSHAIARREKLRETIHANIAAAAAAGVELEEEETGSEEENDSAVDMSEDDFFAKENSDDGNDEEQENPISSLPNTSTATQSNSNPVQTHHQTATRPSTQNKRKMEQHNATTTRGSTVQDATQDHTRVAVPGNLGGEKEKRKRKRKRPKKK
ncbi:hypothetical protein SELMODRAFT_439695 [Selaginella moellendorffii]|uniref:rRNA-processing protein EFG1 n=1 Tax=Selaginella moellendorffii TaxID=88036 RepID=D8R542_SELML|nr:hypothetical protein SELMODRAFT_439695 [Selaginella moellendorffii]